MISLIGAYRHDINVKRTEIHSACVSVSPLLQWERSPQEYVSRHKLWPPSPPQGRCRRCYPDRGRMSCHRAEWRGQMDCHWQRCRGPAAQSDSVKRRNKIIHDKCTGMQQNDLAAPPSVCSTALLYIRLCWWGCWGRRWLGVRSRTPCLWWFARRRLQQQLPHLKVATKVSKCLRLCLTLPYMNACRFYQW